MLCGALGSQQVVVCLPTVRSAYFTGSCSVVKLHTCRGRREGALLRRGAKLEAPRPRTAATGVQVLQLHEHKVGEDRRGVKGGLYTLAAVLADLGCWHGSASRSGCDRQPRRKSAGRNKQQKAILATLDKQRWPGTPPQPGIKT
jgi:hypothetical protein